MMSAPSDDSHSTAMSAPGDSRAARAPCVCLVVLDGWGLAEPGPGNAVSLASTPVFDKLWSTCPHTTLTACGAAVGLPEGQMGNSEVGHLNLGAGAVVKQDLVRIGEAIADGSLARNEVLRAAFAGGGPAGGDGKVVHQTGFGNRQLGGRASGRNHSRP